MITYPFQTVTRMKDNGRQQNVEKHFWVKGHLKTGRSFKWLYTYFHLENSSCDEPHKAFQSFLMQTSKLTKSTWLHSDIL